MGDTSSKENVNKTFDWLDLKRNEKLDKLDLKEIFQQAGLQVPQKEIDEMIRVLASDGENISRQDFLRMETGLYNLQNEKS